jgi:hypothetical protein
MLLDKKGKYVEISELVGFILGHLKRFARTNLKNSKNWKKIATLPNDGLFVALKAPPLKSLKQEILGCFRDLKLQECVFDRALLCLQEEMYYNKLADGFLTCTKCQ